MNLVPEASTLDDGVILGYATDRVESATLRIGRGARLRSGTVIYDGSTMGARLTRAMGS